MAAMYLKSVTGDKQAELSGDIIAGRSNDCDLVLSQGHPSRRHARITLGDDGIWLQDLGSTNGTYVNDQRVEAPVKLQPGDRVRFDVEEFDVVDPAAAAAEPDPNATIMRAPIAEGPATPEAAVPADKPANDDAAVTEERAGAPAAGPAQSAPQPPPARPEGREVAGSAGGRRPGAWADPEQANQGGTVMLNKEQLEALLAAPPSPQPLSDADAPTLTITAGAQAGATIRLKAGQQTNVWDIGRDAARDIQFDENGVSGFHAKIINEGARWKVVDQMSANGTLVNEKRVNISYLSSGDRIRFGPVECVFQLPTAGRARAGGKGNSGAGARTTWLVAAVVVAVLVAAGYFLLAG